ncbi:hypothetical protein [Psychrosphaera aestuarii]|uniref:hypothetical protein n=1 Tax=Psychrosphaera aestuarii TaxID=1266052 RepID=UPI001B3247BF|nr:hypothetical protein [Psychrosphaera aestuarii]
MPLPLIALATVIGTALANENAKKYYRRLDDQRSQGDHDLNHPRTVKMPSSYCSGNYSKEPAPGSVVCCEVFNALDHTGVWIDRDTIIEFSNSGLVKAVSAERFLKERSGNHIYVANDKTGQSIQFEGLADRAVKRVFTYNEYDLAENNCHNFVYQCITNSDDKITLFSSLTSAISNLSGSHVYWDKVKV